MASDDHRMPYPGFLRFGGSRDGRKDGTAAEPVGRGSGVSGGGLCGWRCGGLGAPSGGGAPDGPGPGPGELPDGAGGCGRPGPDGPDPRVGAAGSAPPGGA